MTISDSHGLACRTGQWAGMPHGAIQLNRLLEMLDFLGFLWLWEKVEFWAPDNELVGRIWNTIEA